MLSDGIDVKGVSRDLSHVVRLELMLKAVSRDLSHVVRWN